MTDATVIILSISNDVPNYKQYLSCSAISKTFPFTNYNRTNRLRNLAVFFFEVPTFDRCERISNQLSGLNKEEETGRKRQQGGKLKRCADGRVFGNSTCTRRAGTDTDNKPAGPYGHGA